MVIRIAGNTLVGLGSRAVVARIMALCTAASGDVGKIIDVTCVIAEIVSLVVVGVRHLAYPVSVVPVGNGHPVYSHRARGRDTVHIKGPIH